MDKSSNTKKVLTAIGGAAVSMTLMACYGAPPLEGLLIREAPREELKEECDPNNDPECPEKE